METYIDNIKSSDIEKSSFISLKNNLNFQNKIDLLGFPRQSKS